MPNGTLKTEYQYVRIQNIRNTYTGDEGRASRRDVCLWKAGGSAFVQVKRGIVIEEGKIGAASPTWGGGGILP